MAEGQGLALLFLFGLGQSPSLQLQHKVLQEKLSPLQGCHERTSSCTVFAEAGLPCISEELEENCKKKSQIGQSLQESDNFKGNKKEEKMKSVERMVQRLVCQRQKVLPTCAPSDFRDGNTFFVECAHSRAGASADRTANTQPRGQ